jgi:hypothetical protein
MSVRRHKRPRFNKAVVDKLERDFLEFERAERETRASFEIKSYMPVEQPDSFGDIVVPSSSLLFRFYLFHLFIRKLSLGPMKLNLR